MKLADIQKRQDMENIKFEAAKKIRSILDEAEAAYDKLAKAFGASTWEEDAIEGEVIELVTAE